VDWLSEAGQTWWQMLPVGPPDRHGSPYKSASAFAAWRGLLADPAAEVSGDEIAAFTAANAWAADWAANGGGRRAIADQVRFAREWDALRAHAADRGVKLIGDVPIYVAPGSADHRAHPELFKDGLVAGAPPDAYSDKGQLWGNPFYDWPANRRSGYAWWIERLGRTLALFDVARIDHFRGFVAGWAVPEGDRDARGGRWRRGPGRALFDAAHAALADGRVGPLPFIAEDLGVITPPVERLRHELGLPGMVVAQFAFGPEDADGPHVLEHHTEDRVAYTGTHDSDTLGGFLSTLPPEGRALLDARLRAAGVHGDDPVWGLTRWWMGSVAPLVMLQAQDILELGSEGRMNTPGRATGNWRWQLGAGQLTAAHAKRLRAATDEAGRLPS
jgi:4-alpha-glucanotransferase